MTPADRVADALRRLCALAQVTPSDDSAPAARRVVGVLRRTGCFRGGKFEGDVLLPEMCPLAAWVRMEAAVPLDVPLFVSRETGKTGRAEQPGRVILLGATSAPDDLREASTRNPVWVELPWAVNEAVRLIDQGHGAVGANKEAA